MGRLRKHVENPGLLQLVSPPDQFGTVTRQGRRVAGYIDHSLRTGCSNLPNGFEGAVTRRIEQHGIESLPGPGRIGQRVRQVGLEEVHILQAIGGGISARPLHHGLDTFHRHHLAHLARQRQGEVAEPAEQIQHPLARLRFHPV
ncbi:hypothetical protein D9M68_294950 [compost metagenome]